MYKIKTPDGENNLCGKNVRKFRLAKEPKVSQAKLSRLIQLMGYDVDAHFVRRIENGQRFVTDIELVILAEVLGVTILELLSKPDEEIFPD